MQMSNISIGSSAMLVELNISTWTARKLDKKVSAEVDVAKGAKTSAVNVNKNLLAGTGFLDTITKYAANARAWHLSQTLPWSDNGQRLLPVSNFITYKEQLGKLNENFDALVAKFIDAYPNLVTAAAFQLGDLFNRDEYPDADSIARKFKFNYNFFPVPQAGDFRVDIGEEARKEIEDSCNSLSNSRIESAMKDAWSRLHEHLLRMSERLDYDEVADKKIFRDTLVENAVELVDMLKHFNITRDPSMEQARLALHDAIHGYEASDLRENFVAREAVKRKVDDILGKFNF
jgi:hypothetical protein